jgi:nucleoside-diphosphate-sugar epimerase
MVVAVGPPNNLPLIGLVGGYIVLQLLARGTLPKSIRIVDIRDTERNDMRTGLVSQVDFVQTDITSETAINRSFGKPWDPSIENLPLTVFHTAAVIVPSSRSKQLYHFLEKVNVIGTKNVLAASRAAGASIFSSTSSASISIRPVDTFVSLWATEPRNYWQVLSVQDFNKPLRPHEDYFGNYAASKAAAERLVCDENDASFRTGCIRPANGIYGHPTDNPVGSLLS